MVRWTVPSAHGALRLLLAMLSFAGAAGEPLVVMRYYGLGTANSVQGFPEQVCKVYPALCVNLEPGVCTTPPEEMRAPFHRPDGVTVQSTNSSATGNLVLLVSGQELSIWSGCAAGCADCLAGTSGVNYRWSGGHICGVSQEVGVFLMLDLRVGTMDVNGASVNCVSPGSSFSGSTVIVQDAQDDSAHAVVVGIIVFASSLAFCTVMCLVAAVACLCIALVWRRRELEAAAAAGGRDDVGPEARVIGTAEIERMFPEVPAPEAETCVVCLATIEQGEMCRLLQCGHVFHAPCITRWWTYVPRQSMQCPTCKQTQTLPVDDEDATGPPEPSVPPDVPAAADPPGPAVEEEEDAPDDNNAASVESEPLEVESFCEEVPGAADVRDC